MEILHSNENFETSNDELRVALNSLNQCPNQNVGMLRVNSRAKCFEVPATPKKRKGTKPIIDETLVNGVRRKLFDNLAQIPPEKRDLILEETFLENEKNKLKRALTKEAKKERINAENRKLENVENIFDEIEEESSRVVGEVLNDALKEVDREIETTSLDTIKQSIASLRIQETQTEVNTILDLIVQKKLIEIPNCIDNVSPDVAENYADESIEQNSVTATDDERLGIAEFLALGVTTLTPADLEHTEAKKDTLVYVSSFDDFDVSFENVVSTVDRDLNLGCDVTPSTNDLDLENIQSTEDFDLENIQSTEDLDLENIQSTEDLDLENIQSSTNFDELENIKSLTDFDDFENIQSANCRNLENTSVTNDGNQNNLLEIIWTNALQETTSINDSDAEIDECLIENELPRAMEDITRVETEYLTSHKAHGRNLLRHIDEPSTSKVILSWTSDDNDDFYMSEVFSDSELSDSESSDSESSDSESENDSDVSNDDEEEEEEEETKVRYVRNDNLKENSKLTLEYLHNNVTSVLPYDYISAVNFIPDGSSVFFESRYLQLLDNSSYESFLNPIKLISNDIEVDILSNVSFDKTKLISLFQIQNLIFKGRKRIYLEKSNVLNGIFTYAKPEHLKYLNVGTFTLKVRETNEWNYEGNLLTNCLIKGVVPLAYKPMVEHMLTNRSFQIGDNDNCYWFETGELELLVYEYWKLECSDLAKAQAQITYQKSEDVFILQALYHEFGELAKNFINKQKRQRTAFREELESVLRLLPKFINQRATDISFECLAFLKEKFYYIWTISDELNRTRWCKFFQKLQLEHYLCDHTQILLRKKISIIRKRFQLATVSADYFPDISIVLSDDNIDALLGPLAIKNDSFKRGLFSFLTTISQKFGNILATIGVDFSSSKNLRDKFIATKRTYAHQYGLSADLLVSLGSIPKTIIEFCFGQITERVSEEYKARLSMTTNNVFTYGAEQWEYVESLRSVYLNLEYKFCLNNAIYEILYNFVYQNLIYALQPTLVTRLQELPLIKENQNTFAYKLQKNHYSSISNITVSDWSIDFEDALNQYVLKLNENAKRITAWKLLFDENDNDSKEDYDYEPKQDELKKKDYKIVESDDLVSDELKFVNFSFFIAMKACSFDETKLPENLKSIVLFLSKEGIAQENKLLINKNKTYNELRNEYLRSNSSVELSRTISDSNLANDVVYNNNNNAGIMELDKSKKKVSVQKKKPILVSNSKFLEHEVFITKYKVKGGVLHHKEIATKLAKLPIEEQQEICPFLIPKHSYQNKSFSCVFCNKKSKLIYKFTRKNHTVLETDVTACWPCFDVVNNFSVNQFEIVYDRYCRKDYYALPLAFLKENRSVLIEEKDLKIKQIKTNVRKKQETSDSENANDESDNYNELNKKTPKYKKRKISEKNDTNSRKRKIPENKSKKSTVKKITRNSCISREIISDSSDSSDSDDI